MLSPFKTRKTSRPELTFELARKWGSVFGAPVATIMTIVDIESTHNPRKVNMRAEEKGGAWGLGQQMVDEVDWKLTAILKQYGKDNAAIRKTSRKWKGTGESLLDPDLNMMLTAWQLGRLHRQFGDFPTVAAAYHQGEGAIRARLAAGEPPVGRQQPKGVAYVAIATSTQRKYLESPMMLAIVN